MKKRMFLMVLGMSMTLAMTGCGKGQISTETELQDVEAPATEEETEPVAEEVEEEPEIAEEKPEAPLCGRCPVHPDQV